MTETKPATCQTAISSRLYYFDHNRRIYEMNGVKKNSPYYEGYFVPINVISKNKKKIVCEHGTIEKKTMLYNLGKLKYKVYTEQEKNDIVYVQENRHLIAEKVRTLSADKLRLVEAICENK